MNPSPDVCAAAANDAYKDRPKSDIDNNTKRINFNGQQYSVFGYQNNPNTGFHATAYQNTTTHEIIIAYRGTDPDWKSHTRTMLQDAGVDYTMVKSQVNKQKADADAFSTAMIEKAEKHGISKGHITVAGHSLGGTLAEIEAWKFGLYGTTFNGYGAVDLIHGVPMGGTQVINYVMAGDVVSAGSHHFGEVKVLASVEDLAALRTGRYLDATPGAPPPNPLRAMRLSDHSVTNFTGEAGIENVLAPGNIAAYEARYVQNRAAIDHFREDVHQDRADLGEALRHMDSRSILTTLAHMPPRLQQQLAEVHAVMVDAPIHHLVEHNPLMKGAGLALDYTASTLSTGSARMQQSAEQLSHNVRTSGHAVQQKADEMARASSTFLASYPLVAAGVALGATAVGYTARAEAEGIAQASHFTGQATHAVGRFAAAQVQLTKYTMETSAHVAAQLTTGAVHFGEVSLIVALDNGIAAYDAAQALRLAIGDNATRAYDAAHDAVSQGAQATQRATGRAYDTLTHPGQWFGNASTPLPTQPLIAPVPVGTAPPAATHIATPSANAAHSPEPVVAAPKLAHEQIAPAVAPPIAENLRDFRHADHPLHTKYQDTLVQVHAMEDTGRMGHGRHSEQMAGALVDAMHTERFGSLARVEMRGTKDAFQAVAHQRAPNAQTPERELGVDVNKAMSRTVEQHSQEWSMRALPHVHRQVPAWEREGDARHRDNPNHALFNELRTRLPDASENRLLQCTAACHSNSITAGNLIQSHLNEANMTLTFVGSGPLATLATVNLNAPSPPPQHSNQQIQQYDQQQTQMRSQNQPQSAQVHRQGPTR